MTEARQGAVVWQLEAEQLASHHILAWDHHDECAFAGGGFMDKNGATRRGGEEIRRFAETALSQFGAMRHMTSLISCRR